MGVNQDAVNKVEISVVDQDTGKVLKGPQVLGQGDQFYFCNFRDYYHDVVIKRLDNGNGKDDTTCIHPLIDFIYYPMVCAY